jgi:aminodeoxyfutalosine deaminase
MPVFRARHLATMTTPLIEDGCVVVEGARIVAAGAYRDLKPAKVDHDIDGVLMPGLINAHTHLELTNITRPPAPIAFTDWIIEISQQIRGDKETFASRRADAVRQGIAQCIKFGVTCVGDITQNVDIVRPILREGPIRSVSFGECLGIGERRWRFDELFEKARAGVNDGRCRLGLSPHAPYTVDRDGLFQVRAESALGVPVAMHVAETPDEAAFLFDRSGAFAELYRRLGVDPGPATAFTGSPIRLLADDVAPQRWLLAHVNYCDEDDINSLKEHALAVVWCPRTHAYFGHAPHRWAEMIEWGVTVCVGTDSCASSPDLNVVDDLRLIHSQAPAISPTQLWWMVTTQADEALRWNREAIDDEPLPPPQVGRIEAGTLADLVAFATRSADPLREILETPDMHPSGVWIGGVDVAQATSP